MIYLDLIVTKNALKTTKDQNDLVIEKGLTGRDLLLEPALNKGTAFTVEERNQFDLHGLLPPLIETLEQQCTRAYEAYKRKSDDLERHIFLRAL
ncbi:MAG: hypothetical protein KGI11_10180, partial [Thaumarchaeota archaeon]|nr:hypothetical protein [Nitrososphaerota archaeon]